MRYVNVGYDTGYSAIVYSHISDPPDSARVHLLLYQLQRAVSISRRCMNPH
jgi:hypothetical protein